MVVNQYFYQGGTVLKYESVVHGGHGRRVPVSFMDLAEVISG